MQSEEEGRTQAHSGYELSILRHGIAVARDTLAYPDDAKRPLTPEGKRKMKEIAKGLAQLGHKLDWIVTSPLVRAAETAEIVASVLAPGVPVDVSEPLKPGGTVDALLAFLSKHPERQRTLVVGHESDLSEFAAHLTGAGRHANFGFKKGGCCLIRFDEFPPRSPGKLVWWLTPRVMRCLA